jgi:PAT family beta-lactamase induction signal transducer AmpG
MGGPAGPGLPIARRVDFGVMLLLGFASGLPLFLTNFTLQQWLSESHVSLRLIGATALIGLPYTLKFLWAPLADRISLPFGRRRGWLLIVQPLLALAIFLLGRSDPPHALALLAGLAVAVAFLSASQDIVIDAWRIETFPQRHQGEALACYVWGYRIAILVSQAGALRLATLVGWHGAYTVMAALALFCVVPTLIAREPTPAFARAERGLHGAVIAPLADFLRRPAALQTLAFVLLFQLGTAFADNLASPFYHSLGFDRSSIAIASSVPMIAGGAFGVGVGGVLVRRFGAGRALLACAVVQMASILLYVVLAWAGADRSVLIGKSTLEAFAEGMASAAFLSYLSALCSAAHTATQYALLSSLAPLAWRTVAGVSGVIAERLGWVGYFTAAAAACLPAILILTWLLRHGSGQSDTGAGGLRHVD